jgi:hypothetical protein
MLGAARLVRLGHELAAGFGRKIIPLHVLDQIERPEDGEAAQPVLALQDRDVVARLMLQEVRPGVGLEHLRDGHVEGPRQPPHRGDGRVGLVALDLRDDRFRHPGLLRQVAERHLVGLAQALDRLADARRHVDLGTLALLAARDGLTWVPFLI